jgi:hypothetical protein
MPKEIKNNEIYSKSGDTNIIATFTKNVEHITNTPETGLKIKNYIQVIQSEKDKPEVLMESENIIQQIMFFINEEEEIK